MSDGYPYYAAFLDLKQCLCVVVGGGKVAKRKIEKLLESGAHVKVVSPQLVAQVQVWVAQERIEWVDRFYESGDCEGASLIFAATDDRRINQLVSDDAKRLGKLVNVCDSLEACSFIVPATVRKGALQVAISTSGSHPAVAKQLREALETDCSAGTCHFSEQVQVFLQQSQSGALARSKGEQK